MADETPNPEPVAPAWEFPEAGDLPPDKQFVTKADLQDLVTQLRRPAIDPSRLATDADREIASFVELLEKDPVQGFKKHTEHIVKGVTEQVMAANREMFGAMKAEAETPALREAIVTKIVKNADGTFLNDAAKEYLRDFFSTGYDMTGLQKIRGHQPTLTALRFAAERVHAAAPAGQVKPVGSGGTGGTAVPPAGPGALTADQEADAQEMFRAMSGVAYGKDGKGKYTIEMAREAVRDPMADPSVITQKSSDWTHK